MADATAAATVLGTNVLSDLEVQTLTIPTETSWGATVFQTVLSAPTSNVKQLRTQQLPILALRNKQAHEVRDKVRTVLKDRVATHLYAIEDWKRPMEPRIKESVEQILWSPTSIAAFLNDKHAVVEGMVFWKTILLPLISVVLPILAVIVPFFFLRFLYGTDCVSVEQYTCHVKSVLLKQISIPDVLRSRGEGDVLGKFAEYIFLGLTVFTFASSIWSQITAAMHLRQIALDIRRRGNSILDVVGGIEEIVGALQSLPVSLRRGVHGVLLEGEQLIQRLRSIPRSSGLAAYAHVWNNGFAVSLQGIEEWVGRIDVLQTLSALPNICFPRFLVHGGGGGIQIRGLRHPRLGKEGVVVNDAVLKTSAILTGPNRGGKSTFCRSVGLAILCAQTWGFAFAGSMQLTPFDHIETALHPADSLDAGQSLFESEIEFAKHVLAPREGTMFVMMDEIFHSTNARDGLAASRVFLSQLFERPNVVSIISTHYVELAKDYVDKTVAWAMDADEQENGRLVYKYKVVPGISDKSSVMEILEERGLLGGACIEPL